MTAHLDFAGLLLRAAVWRSMHFAPLAVAVAIVLCVLAWRATR